MDGTMISKRGTRAGWLAIALFGCVAVGCVDRSGTREDAGASPNPSPDASPQIDLPEFTSPSPTPRTTPVTRTPSLDGAIGSPPSDAVIDTPEETVLAEGPTLTEDEAAQVIQRAFVSKFPPLHKIRANIIERLAKDDLLPTGHLSDLKHLLAVKRASHANRHRLAKGGLGTVYRESASLDPRVNCTTTPTACGLYVTKELNEFHAEWFADEVSPYQYLGHSEHLLTYYGSFKSEDGVWHMVFELASGSLDNLMQDSKLSEAERRGIYATASSQIAQGILFMHQKGIAHRDLKPENVLYKKDGSNRYHFKIADLGAALSSKGTRIHAASTHFTIGVQEASCATETAGVFTYKSFKPRKYIPLDNAERLALKALDQNWETGPCFANLTDWYTTLDHAPPAPGEWIFLRFVDTYDLRKADIYAFGQILLILSLKAHANIDSWVGYAVWGYSNSASNTFEALKGQKNVEFNDRFKNLYTTLVNQNPYLRPDIETVIASLHNL